jgi:hypothetical protein
MFSLEALWIAFTLLCAALVDLALHLRSRASLDAFNGSHIAHGTLFQHLQRRYFKFLGLRLLLPPPRLQQQCVRFFRAGPRATNGS